MTEVEQARLWADIAACAFVGDGFAVALCLLPFVFWRGAAVRFVTSGPIWRAAAVHQTLTLIIATIFYFGMRS